MSGKEKCFLVDRVDIFSLIQLLIKTNKSTRVRYFEPTSRFCSRLIQWLYRIGLLTGDVHLIEHDFSKLKDRNGRLIYLKALEDAMELSLSIKRKAMAADPLLQAAIKILENSKVILHFQAILRSKIPTACLRITMTKWYPKLYPEIASDSCTLLVRREKWTPFIEEYGKRKDVNVLSYFSMNQDPRRWKMLAAFLVRVIGGGLHLLWVLVRNHICRFDESFANPGKKRGESPRISDRSPKIAVAYSYRKITLNPHERSELFWLEDSGIRPDQIVLYGRLNREDVDVASIHSLKKRGLQIVGRGAFSTSFRPSAEVVRVFAVIVSKLAVAGIRTFIQGRPVSLFYFSELVILFANYSYWKDFFRANQIRVKIAADSNGSVSQTMALDALGAVSVGFQYSSGVLNSSYSAWTCGENVKFLFSELFVEKWRYIEAPVDHYVFTGLIDDYYIQLLKKHKPVKTWRRQLLSTGAKFIICFFDENSVDRWDHFASHRTATEDYRYLLEWLLADESISLIFKPKQWSTLFDRIKVIRPLIEKAQKTGRCIFLGSDSKIGSIFPAEAAYNADICIGKMLGTAAALEATLAGVDTFLLDHEGVRSREFVNWGHGHFLYYNWDELKAGVEAYRKGHGREELRFGWARAVAELDPYRDGKAGLRIGRFLHWTFEALSSGMTRDEAIRYSRERFLQAWPNPGVRCTKNLGEPPCV